MREKLAIAKMAGQSNAQERTGSSVGWCHCAAPDARAHLGRARMRRHLSRRDAMSETVAGLRHFAYRVGTYEEWQVIVSERKSLAFHADLADSAGERASLRCILLCGTRGKSSGALRCLPDRLWRKLRQMSKVLSLPHECVGGHKGKNIASIPVKGPPCGDCSDPRPRACAVNGRDRHAPSSPVSDGNA